MVQTDDAMSGRRADHDQRESRALLRMGPQEFIESSLVTAVVLRGRHMLVVYRKDLPRETVPCQLCGSKRGVAHHGTKRLGFADIPEKGVPVRVEVWRPRYACSACGRSFVLPVPGLDKKRRVTTRLVEYIRKEVLTRTFVDIAREVGVDERTVHNILHDYLDELVPAANRTPSWLGVAQVRLVSRPRTLLFDPQALTVLDLLPDASHGTLLERLLDLPERALVKVVSLGIWPAYRDAVSTALPEATVVLDPAYLRPLAGKVSRALQSGRSEGRAARGSGSAPAPDPRLHPPGKWIQQLFDILEATGDREHAEELLQNWAAGMPQHTHSICTPLLRAVHEWHEPLLAFVDRHKTHRYSDAAWDLTRRASLSGRGHCFDAVRAALLVQSTGQTDACAAKHARWAKFGAPNTSNDPLADSMAILGQEDGLCVLRLPRREKPESAVQPAPRETTDPE